MLPNKSKENYSISTVAFVISNLSMGGTERVVSVLANQWSFDKKFKIIIITLGNKEPYFPLNDKIQLIQLGENTFSKSSFEKLGNNFKTIRKIRQTIQRFEIDILIGFLTTTNIKLIISSFFLKKKIIISDRNDPYYDVLPSIWKKLRQILYPMANQLVIQSKGVSFFYENLNIKNISIIHNPIELPENLNKINPNNKTIISIGRLVKSKNHNLAIKAFSKAKNNDFTFLIIGDGPERKTLDNLIKSLNLEEQVFLIGKVKNVFEYLAKASIFISLSESEGFPNTLLESMSMGLACIHSDCKYGPNEIIKNNENGILVQQGDEQHAVDALNYYITNPKITQKHGLNAQKIRDSHNVKHIIDQWKEALV